MPGTSELFVKAAAAVQAFFPGQQILGLDELGDGHINDTFKVVLGPEKSGPFVLQRLNRRVFPQPELIMANLRVLADHLSGRLGQGAANFSDWQVVRPVVATDGRDYFIDSANDFWRMLSYVGGTTVFDRVRNRGHAREAGRALGLFHRLVSDLEPGLLVDTLPGFHVTPRYLADYDRLLRRPGVLVSGSGADYCARTIEAHRAFAPVLEDAARKGLLPVRVIHGDPKLTNILFAEKTGRAVSLVDLDTVKPGLLHYDLGDCLRSCCNLAGDAGGSLTGVEFDLGTCRELLGGYLAEMAPLLTEADYEFIYPAVRLLTFELGLRFFTDHLAGDIYFKVDYGGQNLQRALVQFRLLASIEKAAALIGDMVRMSAPVPGFGQGER